MKKTVSLILVLLLIACCSACRKTDNDNSSQIDFVFQESESKNSDTDSENSKIVESEESKNVSSKDTSSAYTQKVDKDDKNKNNNNNDKKEAVTSSKKAHSDNKESITESQTTLAKNVLPKVKFSAKNSDVRFADIINLSNGGYAVVGIRINENFAHSIIQTYDKNLNLIKEYSYEYGYGFLKIAACSDGGFILSAENFDNIIKLNKNFETQWTAPFRDERELGYVQGFAEISPNRFSVVYDSYDDEHNNGRYYVSCIDNKGNFIKKVELMNKTDDLFYSQNIIADGDGGFYLFASCNESMAKNFPLIAKNYDSKKEKEVAVMHFSSDLKLTWVKTLGGKGEDWIEDSAIDSKGNLYIAVGTNSPLKDSLWDMEFKSNYPFRRMLVKLNKKGDLIYKVPLSAGGMASKQTFGIHIKDEKAYVTGMANYFDGYQDKYKCQQIAFSESEVEGRLFCVFIACIDSKGNELSRNIFRCDINDTPYDSTTSANGTLIIVGSVSTNDNPFNVDFKLGIERMAAFFVYK